MRLSIFSGTDTLIEPIRALGRTLEQDDPLDDLIYAIGNARVVLLGEASHGTHEYYAARARITKRLLQEKGFSFVAVEGDWPDCYEVNRYIKGYSDGEMESGAAERNAYDVLHSFDRWPTWMWANWETVALVQWLKRFNDRRPAARQAGFYGLDMYSLWESLDAIMRHLHEFHPEALDEGNRAISCFEPFNREGQQYGWFAHLAGQDCEDEVVELLLKLRSSSPTIPEDLEAHFNAEQNAQVAIGAERYYRTMIKADDHSWNVRDRHMAETLDTLLKRYGADSKAIVWEHNSHVGDARYTDMADAGMVNVGQLVREKYGEESVYIVGLACYKGSVVAGRRWGDPMRYMVVPPAREDSWEEILHSAKSSDQLLLMEHFREIGGFQIPRGHRAIGVVYDPAREWLGNYVPTYLANRYDALIYFERTHALHPIHVTEHFTGEAPETFPWGV